MLHWDEVNADTHKAIAANGSCYTIVRIPNGWCAVKNIPIGSNEKRWQVETTTLTDARACCQIHYDTIGETA